jgi:signal transduction histidine kinase
MAGLPAKNIQRSGRWPGREREEVLEETREYGERESTRARAFLKTKKPFTGAIRSLEPRKKVILAAWKRQLNGLWGDMEIYNTTPEIALWEAIQRVPQMSFRTFRGGIEALGADFARRAVTISRVITALSSLLEIAVQYVIRDSPDYALALLRMSLIARYVLVSAYSRHWQAQVTNLEERLYDAEQRLLGTSAYVTGVYENERRRLSHDLHDEIGHDLVVLKLRLELISADVDRNNFALVAPRLNDALELIGHAIDSVRRLVMDLGPAVFDDLGFLPAIRLYARQFTASTGIEVSVREGDMPAELARPHQTALYRVLQGALSNVLRHSKARHVTVAFACLKNSILVMTVEDDGIGFDATGARAKQRFGLTAMRERIAVLGGKVHVQSCPASTLGGRRGTRIEVDLPLAGAG